ncbi:hypothetical protein GKE82_17130 [Conexibacter sp. W3-3-2]|nr:hypothetical protein [Conexibacter sp. W3-3-2]
MFVVPVPLVAALSFLLGFGVADLTGVRPLGGLVLVAGGVWCARQVRPVAGTARTVVLLLVALALFVVSHPLGHEIGSWAAVLVVSALVALAAAVLGGPPRGRASRAAA